MTSSVQHASSQPSLPVDAPDVWDQKHKFIDKKGADDTTFDQATFHVNDLQALLYNRKGAEGKDIQGIQWERITVASRGKYHKERITQYENYSKFGDHKLKTLEMHHQALREIEHVEDNCLFYNFRLNSRTASCSLTHFQLRHLLSATSKHDVYYMDDFCVSHWNSSCGLTGHGVANKVIDLKNDETLGRVVISSLAALDNIVLAGGFKGELACKDVKENKMLYKDFITKANNAITNYVQLTRTQSPLSPSSQMMAIVSSNDCAVRIFDIPSFNLLREYTFEWPVNHATISPCGKMLLIAGDDEDCYLLDIVTGKTISVLKGHHDYSFASAWRPHKGGMEVATGAQDRTCRIWDLRKMKYFKCFGSNLGCARSLAYREDGRVLVASECADFVHIYDAESNYTREQKLDMFGEIAGISLSPEGETLYVGVYDKTYKSLLEFSKVKHGETADDFFV